MSGLRCTCPQHTLLAASETMGELWMVRQQRSIHFQGAGTFTITCDRCRQLWDIGVTPMGSTTMVPYRHTDSLD